MRRKVDSRRILIAAALLAGWGGAAHAEPTPLSFAEALRRARARNPDVLIASQEIDRARAVVEEVRSSSLPTLRATGVFTQLNADRLSQTNGNVVALPATEINVSGTAALQIDARALVQWSQAHLGVEVSRLSAQNVGRQLVATVGQVYLALAAQHRIVSSNEHATANARSHVDYTRSRYQGGNGTLLDLQRAIALYASDRALLDRSLVVVVRLEEQLGTLLGEDGPLDVTPEISLPWPAVDTTLDVGQAIDDADGLRVDLRLSRERLALSTKVRRESWADFLPSLSLTYQLFYQNPPIQTYPTTGWQFFATLQVPLYDGGLRYGLLKERLALEREAQVGFDAQRRAVGADVRTARAQVAKSRTALDAAREAARVSAEVERLATIAYQSGLSTNIEVIDAQLASLNTAVTAALAENDQLQAELDLALASGTLR